MKYNFYEYFYLLLKITVHYGIMDARAEMDATKVKFYKDLDALIKQIAKETKEYSNKPSRCRYILSK